MIAASLPLGVNTYNMCVSYSHPRTPNNFRDPQSATKKNSQQFSGAFVSLVVKAAQRLLLPSFSLVYR